MKNIIKSKKIATVSAMLIILTTLVFYACKDEINTPADVEPKDPIIVDDIEDLGEAPTCYFRFYTRVDPFSPNSMSNKKIFHGFNASPSNPDWTGYKPEYLKLNGQDWPITDGGAYQFLSTGENGYIEHLNVVMEYKGTEFKWNMNNMAEINFAIHFTDTVEIDRNKPFTIKYSGGNSGADTTKLFFNCIEQGVYNDILTQDNGNIVVSPSILRKFPAGLCPMTLGIGRYTEADTKHEGKEVRIDIDNIQGTVFMAKFK